MHRTIQKNISQEIVKSDSEFYQTGDDNVKNQQILSIDNEYIVKTQYQSNYMEEKIGDDYAINQNKSSQ
jgi:hypothetical protein